MIVKLEEILKENTALPSFIKFKVINLIEKKKAYHGGGDNGYFGIVVGAFSETELNNIIQEILKNVTENNS